MIPTKNRLIVKLSPKDAKSKVKLTVLKGEVKAVNNACEDFKVGDKVMFSPYGYDDVGNDMIVIDEGLILTTEE